ncbi:hypothetical protein P7C70_g6689, partial [Phenoliferia sp. Uapishka_3]
MASTPAVDEVMPALEPVGLENEPAFSNLDSRPEFPPASSSTNPPNPPASNADAITIRQHLILRVLLSLREIVNVYSRLAPTTSRSRSQTPERRAELEATRRFGSPTMDRRVRQLNDVALGLAFCVFLLLNIYVLTSKTCRTTSPPLFWTSVVALIFSYLFAAEIILIILAIIFVLPLALIGIRFWGWGEKSNEIGPLKPRKKHPTDTYKDPNLVIPVSNFAFTLSGPRLYAATTPSLRISSPLPGVGCSLVEAMLLRTERQMPTARPRWPPSIDIKDETIPSDASTQTSCTGGDERTTGRSWLARDGDETTGLSAELRERLAILVDECAEERAKAVGAENGVTLDDELGRQASSILLAGDRGDGGESRQISISGEERVDLGSGRRRESKSLLDRVGEGKLIHDEGSERNLVAASDVDGKRRRPELENEMGSGE